VRRKVDQARRRIERWLRASARPAISCSGGKDSTVLLQLVREIDPSVPVYRADPPNPLPDRPVYVAQLAMAAGGEWRVVPYPWDVDAVLRGEARYPALLKVRRLEAALTADGIDGVALGLRAEESRGRLWNARTRGALYRTRRWWTCTPLVEWTAEEIVGYLLATDRLPLNPVYQRLELAPALTHLRDGTWFPRETPDAHGYRAWLARHYPEVLPSYDQAVRVGATTR
jgi:3'-phosphoadenosine 5'-phosphosulfate sulfotransferase (PAPS reductase)/FAD synthetase